MTVPEVVHRPRTVLVTGGCGFIGVNWIRWALANDAQLRIVNVDALTYAGNRESLDGLDPAHAARLAFVQADIADAAAMAAVFRAHAPDTVVHLAAESHVDRSIDGPSRFVQTNVVGTAVLLEQARHAWTDRDDVRFHHVSTDEVFGSLGPDGRFDETSAYDPSSPYSASKAGADHLVRAWHRTFGLPVTLSNCSNNYGPYQFPEKLIPLMIARGLAYEPLPVYGDGSNVRDWVYVTDHCEAVDRILRCAPTGTTWLVGGDNEWRNLDLVHLLCDRLDALRPTPGQPPRRELVRFVRDRPGHDHRYAIDAGRLARDLHWTPRHDFAAGLDATIRWYLDHATWVARVQSGAYRGERLGLGQDTV